MRSTVDITPHPKILRVLGEIEFKPWQCIAELVDNSIDGFLAAKRAGTAIVRPHVKVVVGGESVSVKDNGIGMDLDALEMAVKAGWSSQEDFGSLGLYGIGFNIATARLGSKTIIWTTRTGEERWYGLEINLPALAKGKSFTLDVRTRMKSHSSMSGTEVEVLGLRQDWREFLQSRTWLRNNVTEKLGRIYGTMLRTSSPDPIGFSLHVNEQPVQAWEHCVWPADWAVFRKGEGSIRPVREVDVPFGMKYQQISTGEIFDSADGLSPEDMREIPQRVYGWIGVQRYADEKDYGIDILRNGRKIELGSKDLFYWDETLEYPIDEQRHRRGRIVGEIHLDHGYVNYTKHRFEREHSSWQQLLQAVRYNEPLINRSKYNLKGGNSSPLGIIFRGFRRNSPQSGSGKTWDSILFIQDNPLAKRWAENWRKGIVEYHDDEKWRKLLEDSDAVPPPPTPDPSKDPPKGDEPKPGGAEEFILGGGTPTDGGTTPESSEPAAVVERTALAQLNLHATGVGSTGVAYDLEVYAVQNGSPQKLKLPWVSRPTAKGIYEIEVDVHHEIFKSLSFRVEDAVVADFAHFISSEESAKAGVSVQTGFSSVLTALRHMQPGSDSLDAAKLEADTRSLRVRLTSRLATKVPDTAMTSLVETLAPHEREKLELAYASSADDVPFAEFLQLSHLIAFLEIDPAPLFEAGLFRKQWTPVRLKANPELLAVHRERLVREISLPLTVVTEIPGTSTETPTRTHMALVRAALNKVNELVAV